MKKENTPITVYYCGREKCNPGHSFGPAVRPHYLMHFVLYGKGLYQVRHLKMEVRAGECFLIKPGETTVYRADEKDPWEYVWIAFDGLEAERLLEDYGFTDDTYIRTVAERNLYIEKINEVFMENGLHQDALIGLLYYIFSGIPRAVSRDGRHIDRGYLEAAIDYIRYNYSYSITVRDIAMHIGIERTYLYKLFMKYKGIAPKEYLTAYRLQAAKDMLGNTDLSVTEIALSCGFHDASVLCKNFKRQESLSPLQYRKELALIYSTK